MRRLLGAILILLSFGIGQAFSQVDLQPLLQTQREFEKAASERGMRSAFLEFLRDDAIVFQPHPVNGKEYWSSREVNPGMQLVRKANYSDISANGLLGYTTGNWRLYQKGDTEDGAKFGQYVTIWEKNGKGKFNASVDIAIAHDKLTFLETDSMSWYQQTRDINKRGWSPADTAMNFFRASMGSQRLGGAYKKYAGDDVRLLIDGEPPIRGKKRVVEQMREYISLLVPPKVFMFQAADMAYTWNSCSFADSNEGSVQGNCLHIWKLRSKKWWIVMGVFAPVPNEKKPALTVLPKR